MEAAASTLASPGDAGPGKQGNRFAAVAGLSESAPDSALPRLSCGPAGCSRSGIPRFNTPTGRQPAPVQLSGVFAISAVRPVAAPNPTKLALGPAGLACPRALRPEITRSAFPGTACWGAASSRRGRRAFRSRRAGGRAGHRHLSGLDASTAGCQLTERCQLLSIAMSREVMPQASPPPLTRLECPVLSPTCCE